MTPTTTKASDLIVGKNMTIDDFKTFFDQLDPETQYMVEEHPNIIAFPDPKSGWKGGIARIDNVFSDGVEISRPSDPQSVFMLGLDARIYLPRAFEVYFHYWTIADYD